MNPATSASRTIVDIGASAKLELVDKFCYLGGVLSADGDADAAVEATLNRSRDFAHAQNLIRFLTQGVHYFRR